MKKTIIPILIATNYSSSSTDIQMSVYDDRVVNPLVAGKSGVAKLIADVKYYGLTKRRKVENCNK